MAAYYVVTTYYVNTLIMKLWITNFNFSGLGGFFCPPPVHFIIINIII